MAEGLAASGQLDDAQGNREQARQLLAPVYAQFTEGFETGDLKAAKEFLLSLAEG